MIRLRCVCAAALALYTACGDNSGITSDLYDAGTKPSETTDAKVSLDAQTSTTRDTGTRPVLRADGSQEPNPACVNLQCEVRACPGGGTTSVSGIVYDPAGKNPLYNVAVFVPNTTPEPFDNGASCDTCNSLYTGSPVVSTLTDAKGAFKLDNVPVGTNIPLVIQIGKWRRQLKLATVAECTDNPQPDKSLRLPKNRSEGDIPLIAVSTGGADTLECLLRRIGVDASEYVPGANDAGRIQIYRGKSYGGNSAAPNTNPSAPDSETSLWNSSDSLLRYDLVLLSCEGDETQKMNQQALHDYASTGGRVFASHFHYSWFNTGPYGSENLASWRTGSNDIGDINADIVTTLADGKAFAKGVALKDWLGNVGALTNGRLRIEDARHNADVSAANDPSQPWIVAAEGNDKGATQYFSFNTPTDALANVGDTAPMYCGRVVYSDLHVGAASGDDKGKAVPTGCSNRDLSPQEKALEFMLFDLSSCITPDELPPAPPPPII
ncbi:MAG TPA: carboxypeptidase regulatory-like domain-containing protein [Polyangiales bacterium]|nr:carboxypeptidase regulatory-like domain-containing protein [Polyangiales bacterium]